jgi:hypothetical protein
MKNRTMKYSSLKERYQILLEGEATDPKPAPTPTPEPEAEPNPSAEKQKLLEDFKNGLKSAFDDFDSKNSEKIANIIINLKVKELNEFLGIAKEESKDGGGEGEEKSTEEEVKKVEDVLGEMDDDEKAKKGLKVPNFKRLIDFLRNEEIIE